MNCARHVSIVFGYQSLLRVMKKRQRYYEVLTPINAKATIFNV